MQLPVDLGDGGVPEPAEDAKRPDEKAAPARLYVLMKQWG